jgi:hypothetical protein
MEPLVVQGSVNELSPTETGDEDESEAAEGGEGGEASVGECFGLARSSWSCPLRRAS